MNIVYKVSPEFLKELKNPDKAEGGETSYYVQVLAMNNMLTKRRPLHPGSADAELSRWFVISDVEDNAQTQKFLKELSAVEGVEAAYLKPADAAPGAKAGRGPCR